MGVSVRDSAKAGDSLSLSVDVSGKTAGARMDIRIGASEKAGVRMRGWNGVCDTAGVRMSIRIGVSEKAATTALIHVGTARLAKKPALSGHAAPSTP